MLVKKLKASIPFLFSFFICFMLRFILINIPNVEPINAFIVTNANRFNYFVQFNFALFNILLFDILTLKFGIWSIFTAFTYAILALFSFLIKKNKINIITYTVLSTIIYDILTGIIFGALFFKQNILQLIIGQIPFTAMHIIGNLVLTLAFALVYELFVVVKFKLLKNKKVSC